MSRLEDAIRDGDIPVTPQPPPQNKSYNVVVTYENRLVEYERVRGVNFQNGMVILQSREKEVIIPITNSVLSISITEDKILT